ncbi:MAG: hypothetical protein ACI84O_001145 [Myxococcota bacterium]|jgi:hypothetical protein
MQTLLIIGGVCLVGFMIYSSWKYHKERRAGFVAWAQKNNFRFRPERDRGLANRFMFLNNLNNGSNRYGYDYLHGIYAGFTAHAFTYHYETYSTDSKGNRQTHHHNLGVVAIEIEQAFPELRIHPESIFAKFGQLLGYDDIDFESIEFSKKYAVRSEDKKLAYDFCNTGMMEYLLKCPKTALELDGHTLAVYDGAKLEPRELDAYLLQLTEIRALMPAYLFKK